CYQHTNDYHSF
nr:immunoglobulin light chain junction region [Macaca mulatta]